MVLRGLGNALSGNVAGVQILSDNGQPGSSATVRIRGVGSISKGDGTYTFTVNDEYGISYPDDGVITITFEGVEIAKIVGDFGKSASKTFTLGGE